MLLGLSGCIGSGKDTVANYLASHDFIKLSYADSLKDICSSLFGWKRELIEGTTNESREFRETIDTDLDQLFTQFHISDDIPMLQQVTPRKILQFLGTDLFRKHMHENIWICLTVRNIQSLLSQGKHVVVTDCRFQNEIDAIKQLGGTTIKIIRKPVDDYFTENAKQAVKGNSIALARMKETNMHESEWMVYGLECDHTVMNTKTIDDLFHAIQTILEVPSQQQL